MVSTARDYAGDAGGGRLDGQLVIGPATERFTTSDRLGAMEPGPYYLPGAGYGFGLSVAVWSANGGGAPSPGDAGGWFWGGAGGTCTWADPARGVAVVFIMQSPQRRLRCRRLLRDLLNAALLD